MISTKFLSYKTLIVLLTFVTFCGCEVVMEIDAKDVEPKLIIQSYLTNEDSIAVVISSSSSIFDGHIDDNSATDPKVMLSINRSEYIVLDRDDSYNTFFTNDYGYLSDQVVITGNFASDSTAKTFIHKYTPKPGDDISFKIENPDTGETLYGETTIPLKPRFKIEVISIDTAYYSVAPPLNFQEDYLDIELRCTIQDPPNERNYYKLDYIDYTTHHIQDINGDRRAIRYISSNDPIFNGRSYTSPYFDDLSFDGKTYSFTFRLKDRAKRTLSGDDEYSIIYGNVRLVHYSEEMYLHLKTIQKYTNDRGDIFSQPQRPYSNIQGDCYGFIGGAYHSYSDTLKYFMKCLHTLKE